MYIIHTHTHTHTHTYTHTHTHTHTYTHTHTHTRTHFNCRYPSLFYSAENEDPGPEEERGGGGVHALAGGDTEAAFFLRELRSWAEKQNAIYRNPEAFKDALFLIARHYICLSVCMYMSIYIYVQDISIQYIIYNII
jgi:hypothetical protein